MAVLWGTYDYGSTSIGRGGDQPQSDPKTYARDGDCRDLPWSKFEQAHTKGRHLSLSFASYNQSISQSYLGAGYHLHSPGVGGWMYLVAVLDWYSRYVVSWLRHEGASVAVEADKQSSTWCSTTSTLPRPASGVIPINVVTTNKPTVLTGLNQHARKRASYQRGEPPTFYGNESMLNVSLVPEREARTRV